MRVLSGRYELVEAVGRGGMGEVWRALDRELGRTVAVKVLPPELTQHEEFRSRFRREARTVASLSHRGVAVLHDVGEDGEGASATPYLVMEFIEGRTLAEVLRDGPLNPQRAAAMVRDVADALAHSHSQGLIHRDIKPSNIMVTSAGAVKVLDFGIAKVVAETTTRLTATGMTVGTPAYLSPEQIEGGQVDVRTDQYSVGCLLYELLTGRPPFIGDSPFVVMHQHLAKEPTPPSALRPQLSAQFDQVVMRTLTKDPDGRFAGAGALRDALNTLADGGTVAPSAGGTRLADAATPVAAPVPAAPTPVPAAPVAAAAPPPVPASSPIAAASAASLPSPAQPPAPVAVHGGGTPGAGTIPAQQSAPAAATPVAGFGPPYAPTGPTTPGTAATGTATPDTAKTGTATTGTATTDAPSEGISLRLGRDQLPTVFGLLVSLICVVGMFTLSGESVDEGIPGAFPAIGALLWLVGLFALFRLPEWAPYPVWAGVGMLMAGRAVGVYEGESYNDTYDSEGYSDYYYTYEYGDSLLPCAVFLLMALACLIVAVRAPKSPHGVAAAGGFTVLLGAGAMFADSTDPEAAWSIFFVFWGLALVAQLVRTVLTRRRAAKRAARA
ncbi:protein kinase domain-containing protein [Streptomyces sp. NPDC004838]